MDFLLREALQYLGVPYKWGGSNPIEGFDCSGFIQWLLMSVGIDPPGDQTAQGLFNHFEKLNGVSSVTKAGVLCFYGESVAKITHVALCISPYQIIEAGGGNSLTLTKADAEKQNACVRIRHIGARKDLVAKIYPSYVSIGLI